MPVAATAAAWLAHLRTASSAVLWALGWLLRAGYLATVPLRYPLYYAFRLVLFLLSPVGYVFGAVASAAGLLVEFVARFKVRGNYLDYLPTPIYLDQSNGASQRRD
ncbi:hypothetical protein SLS62_003748 [Diatrype stigma]|uniref:Uncharacterized protein n=1 Tax=Diatrype stigma TaxID=117547 RepID=A0AAN9UVC6_9PEZI